MVDIDIEVRDMIEDYLDNHLYGGPSKIFILPDKETEDKKENDNKRR